MVRYGLPENNFGAGDGVRTRDLHLGKVPLYQLSHSRNDTDYSIADEKMQTSGVSRSTAYACVYDHEY